jgi:hypothetical protein
MPKTRRKLMGTKKPYGYVVSGSRVKHGVYCKTLTAAKKEMNRQMFRLRSKESGIREVSKEEWLKRRKK